MLPYTPTEFIGILAGYNGALWPLHFGGLAVALALLWLLRLEGERPARAAWLLLGALWLWTGCVFFIFHLAQLSMWWDMVGLLFLFEGGALWALAAWDGWPTRTVSPARQAAGFAIAAYALLGAPLLGLAGGLSLSQVAAPGWTPTSLALLTFAALLLSPVRVPRYLLALPTLWAVWAAALALAAGGFSGPLGSDLAAPLSAIACWVLLSRPASANAAVRRPLRPTLPPIGATPA